VGICPFPPPFPPLDDPFFFNRASNGLLYILLITSIYTRIRSVATGASNGLLYILLITSIYTRIRSVATGVVEGGGMLLSSAAAEAGGGC
jgi:hypothetical protein